ncbi:MAG TPA: hypothetical protein VKX28_33745 [Xanthobacteraceae bacterium]|jgi:hypothetical protein|nr:hypothetical protein [Xanthobacteraceae bacterium]
MTKRAVDLSLGELAALGAKAARTAAQETQRAGHAITGLITVYDEAQPQSVLAQLHSSGTVTLVRAADDVGAPDPADGARAKPNKAAD